MSNVLQHQDGRRKRSEKTEDMRRRILEESVKLFLEQGYEKTTTRQILQRVGILNGSLYNIYRSKEDIFSDIIMIALKNVADEAPEEAVSNGWVDRIAYVLCTEVYISKRSQRVAELLSLLNGKQAIRDKVYRAVLTWTDSPETRGHDCPVMNLDALVGVTSSFVQRMVLNPEAVDIRRAMRIIVILADRLFENGNRDVEEVVDRFERCLSRHEITVCGTPIL